MGKDEPSSEEIIKWIKEGWKFYKRPKGGHLYITRRKGPKLEKSLGPYSEALWQRIQKIKGLEEGSIKDSLSILSSQHEVFYNMLDEHRGYRYAALCLHKDVEGFCTYWSWDPRLPLLSYRGDLSIKKVEDDDGTAILFLAHGGYCKNCSAFTSSQKYAVIGK